MTPRRLDWTISIAALGIVQTWQTCGPLSACSPDILGP
jgi:hypothetical protein